MVRIFVYGSLLSGESNHHVLGITVFEPALTRPQYALLDLGPYPGLIEGNLAIVGELYVCDAATIARLDVFEGAHYRRGPVLLERGEAEAYFFIGPRRGARAIATGNWRRK